MAKVASDKRVVKTLRALAQSVSKSETARLRVILDDVEATLNAGVSQSKVLEALHAQGFTMTAKSFESALYRLRKQRNKNKEQGNEI